MGKPMRIALICWGALVSTVAGCGGPRSSDGGVDAPPSPLDGAGTDGAGTDGAGTDGSTSDAGDPETLCPWSGPSVSVTAYWQAGDASWKAAIDRADAYLAAEGGGTILFPAGDYQVVPTIQMSPNIKWRGEGVARLYTEETSVYNRIVATGYGDANNCIENLVFDQWGDAAQVPTTGPEYNTLTWIHVVGDGVQIHHCTFYSYGVCAVLAQSPYQAPIDTVTVDHNRAYFKRKVDAFYDVSVFNIDGRTVTVTDNAVEGVKVPGFRYWKPRTAYEVHMPNGTVSRNASVNTEVGIIHVAWPTLWDTYEPDYRGTLAIADNDLRGTLLGIDLWGPCTLPDIVTRNLTIKGNHTSGELTDVDRPVRGIGITDIFGAGRFENLVIEGNTIDLTWDPALYPTWQSRVDVYHLLVPGRDTGAIHLNTATTIAAVVVKNNTVTGFPFAFLNLGHRGSGTHSDLEVFGNQVIDSAWALPFEGEDKYLVNLGGADQVSIHDNEFSNPNTTRQGGLNLEPGATNITFVNNPDLPDYP